MQDFESISHYFKPIQPSVNSEEGHVIYQEYKPHGLVNNYIYCYWQLHTDQTLDSPYVYRVVSDGCIDIFFNLTKPSQSSVMGFCKNYTEFSIGREFNYCGIRFYPSAFPLLFNVSAKTLKDKYQALQLILPELAAYISKEIGQDFHSAIATLNDFFIQLTQESTLETDSRFAHALLHIYKHNGHLETERELIVGLSPRQLRRLFNYYIGTTPKSFCQVVRFQYILNASLLNKNSRDDKLYYDVGFSDQAHFIKNFTQFYGVTPAKALK